MLFSILLNSLHCGKGSTSLPNLNGLGLLFIKYLRLLGLIGLANELKGSSSINPINDLLLILRFIHPNKVHALRVVAVRFTKPAH